MTNLSGAEQWDVAGIPGEWSRDGLEGIESLLSLPASARAALLTDWIVSIREQAKELGPDLAAFTGVSVGECLASPFAFRATLMGVHAGVACVHEEARSQRGWKPHMQSEDGSLRATGDIWNTGQLCVSKYASFCQDGPFVSFHPDHSSKWTPHEMVHRALGFFHREGMSRWELYMGARLNEALPVGFWYGLDRMARLDEDPKGPALVAGVHDAPIEQVKWLTEEREALLARVNASLEHLTLGLRWALDELSAVEEECETGVISARPGGFLNGSTDAMAYVVAHWNRLTAPELMPVLREHTTVGTHRFESVPDYIQHWKSFLWEFLFGQLSGSFASSLVEREKRGSWDRALLKAVSEERIDEDDEMTLAIHTGQLWAENLETEVDWNQLVDGLEQILPATIHGLSEGDPEAQVLGHFVEGGYVNSRGMLHHRFIGALDDFDAPFLADLARFEGLLGKDLVRSDASERLRMSPPASPEFEEGVLIHHPGFRLETLSPDVLQYHCEVMGSEPMEWGTGVFLIGRLGEDVFMLPAPPAVAGIWLHLRAQPRPVASVLETLGELLHGSVFPAEWPQGPDEWIREFIGAGACSWTPTWRGLRVDVLESTG